MKDKIAICVGASLGEHLLNGGQEMHRQFGQSPSTNNLFV